MTQKQEEFCRYYVKLKNGTQAAIKAGYPKKSAYEIAHQNLKKIEIKLRIRELRELSFKLNNITEKNLKEELASIAYHNIDDLVNWETEIDDRGRKKFKTNIKNSNEIDTRAIKEITITREGDLKFKCYDKGHAIRILLEELKYQENKEEEEDLFYDLDNIRVNPHFEKWFFEEYNNPEYLYHILKGGRGSGKSTSAARRFVKDILQFPINILVVRKIHSTLLESCYEDLKQAINDLGVSDEFRCVGGNQPYIRRKRTGQKFIFRGGLEPEKIKSIKTSKYPIARLWVEEPTEFKKYEELKIIFDSVVRANLPEGVTYKIILTYNPPKLKGAWTNKMYNTQFINKNTFVDHSISFDNPHLSKEFLEEAENVKLSNEKRYLWNYMGEAIGGGITPFSNLTFREITDEEIFRFDNILQGIDWGWSINPAHFTRLHFDETKRKIYIFGEINGLKLNDEKLAKKIVAKRWNDIIITCDSEDPKSIANIKAYGCKSRGAKKGSGSVEHGLEWLDGLTEIIIDPKRCPKTAKNFEDADYKTDRNGELLDELDKKLGVDAIDAVRYATEHKHYSKRKFF
jgi:PBSX family phage terminase large subunit